VETENHDVHRNEGCHAAREVLDLRHNPQKSIGKKIKIASCVVGKTWKNEELR